MTRGIADQLGDNKARVPASVRIEHDTFREREVKSNPALLETGRRHGPAQLGDICRKIDEPVGEWGPQDVMRRRQGMQMIDYFIKHIFGLDIARPSG